MFWSVASIFANICPAVPPSGTQGQVGQVSQVGQVTEATKEDFLIFCVMGDQETMFSTKKLASSSNVAVVGSSDIFILPIMVNL